MIIGKRRGWSEMSPFRILLVSSVIVTLCLFFTGAYGQTTNLTQPNKPLFAIDLQDGFQQDSVMVMLDNQLVYGETATTSLALSLAHRITSSVSTGSHIIKVSMPTLQLQADTSVNVQDTLVLGVNFNRSQHQLSFTLYHFWVMYR
jgi:hypothetical protein